MRQWIFLFFLLVPLQSWSQSCEEVFHDQHSIRMETPTPEQLQQGIWFKVKKKSDEPWFSQHGPFDNAPQGDPRWPFLILGSQIASVLGFEMTNVHTISVPTVERINWGIRRLNARLSAAGLKTIPYSFYKQTQAVNKSYNRRAAQGKIPINVNDLFLAIHDMNFHVTILAEPPIITQRRLVYLNILNRFSEFLLQYPKHASQAAKDSIVNRTDLSLASHAIFYGITHQSYIYRKNFQDIDPQQLEPLMISSSSEKLETVPGFLAFEAANLRWVKEQFFRLRTMAGAALTPSDVVALTIERRREMNRVLNLQPNIQATDE
jgi:hypothetical protein